MLKNILAIAAILACTTVAWTILGSTLTERTAESSEKLTGGVISSWGAPQEQRPPVAAYTDPAGMSDTVLQPESSRITVSFDLDHRQKGLLWYSTYAVDFSGLFEFRNTTADERAVSYRMLFPAQQAVYDDAVIEIDGKPVPIAADASGITASAPLAAGASAKVRVAYRSHGLESWKYRFGDKVSQAHDFTLAMKTNFDAVDFPANTISPTSRISSGQGWLLTWRYNNLIAGGYQIGMRMPEKLQPGPIAGQITFFAPVSLLMFFFLIFIITTMKNVNLHPMNYFFLAAAFFSFHLLLAYLVDHISIHVAFLICSTVSVFLVVSYLRLVTGLRFALIEAGLAQLVYLVLFSYSFFIQGFAGLTAAIGCILTLFIVMQLTGRMRWAEKFARIEQAAPQRT